MTVNQARERATEALEKRLGRGLRLDELTSLSAKKRSDGVWSISVTPSNDSRPDNKGFAVILRRSKMPPITPAKRLANRRYYLKNREHIIQVAWLWDAKHIDAANRRKRDYRSRLRSSRP